MINPFASAQGYFDAGWSPIPLPYKAKKFPPKGWTGKNGQMTTEEQIRVWQSTNQLQNIALRLPDGVIGFDVDHYGDKTGGKTLQEKMEDWGPLPKTIKSGSRQGPSGIYYYAVPLGEEWPQSLGDGVEIIQRHHRYAVVAPSLHPDVMVDTIHDVTSFGKEAWTDTIHSEPYHRVYRWYNMDGTETDEITPVWDLPQLPPRWVEGLRELRLVGSRSSAGQVVGDDWRTVTTEVGQTPGDDFCVRADWSEDILIPAGWKFVKVDPDGVQYWQRPLIGDEVKAADENSACIGGPDVLDRLGQPALKVFTSSTAFRIGKTYNKFAAYAILFHDGEYSEAAKELVRKGYGKQETTSVDDLKDYRGGDVENGRLFSEWYGEDFRWVHERKGWYWFNGEHWEQHGDLRAQERAKLLGKRVNATAWDVADEGKRKFLQKEANNLRSVRGVTGAIAMAKDTLVSRLEEFDSHRYLLNCGNGTLDLSRSDITTVLREFRREDLLTGRTRWNYDPEAQCPTWEKFLQRATEHDEELYYYIQKIVGYCLTGDVNEKSIFFLWGITDSGKTRFAEAIRSLLGSDYVGVLRDDALMQKFRTGGGNTDEIASLVGKRLATVSELKREDRLNAALVKQLTGGGRVSAMRKYERSFEFDPHVKILIDTNYKPQVLLDDEALWNRIRLIEFKVRIPKEEQDLKLHDKFLVEMPGILAWAVRGWFMYKKEGLRPPAKVEAAVAEYRKEEDWFGDWFDEYCVAEEDARDPFTHLYNCYKDWATESGMRPLTAKLFGQTLSEKGYEVKKAGGTAYRTGLRLRGSSGV